MSPVEPRPWAGEVITEPGIYTGVPMDLYHGDICDGPSISSSGLRLIESKSPAHYWDQSYLNPDRAPEEPKDHFDLGRAVHTLLLGEKGFGDQYAVRPAKWADWRTKDAQDWRAASRAAGLTVLTEENLVQIRGMAEALQREPLIQSGLFSGLVEASMFWKDPETGVWLKARPDVLNLGDLTIADLKTASDASEIAVRRSITEYGYHIQLALVAEGIEVLTRRKVPDDGCILVFVETKRPHCVNLAPVAAQAVYDGRRQMRRALRTFAECVTTGQWPGYTDSGVTKHLQPWLDKRLEREASEGLLPDPLDTGATL